MGDKEGRHILRKGKIEGKTATFLNVYGTDTT